MLQTILKVSIRAGLALVLALLTLQGSGTATADEGENASAFSVVTSEVRLIPVGHDGMTACGSWASCRAHSLSTLVTALPMPVI
ncbi:MAG: hypothetical protein ACKVH7_11935 [Alphaproteobacteria bacterium]|jgi:hypothetical protein